MAVFVRRFLAVLAVLGALVLVLAAAGLLPAAEPPPPHVEPFSIEKAVVKPSRVLQKERDAGAPEQARSLRFVPLCEAPTAGARWYKLASFAGQDALLVWCKSGYELFYAGESTGELTVTRAARFKARGDLPGGAAAGDFDGDGQRDLVLGVSAGAGVAHRSGAGVYWLRGRAQGGFEHAQIVSETSSVAIAAFTLRAGHPDELVVLTAGDVAAQRSAELWLYTHGPSLRREQIVPIGLDPRGLVLRAGGAADRMEVYALTGQPGQLTNVGINLHASSSSGSTHRVALRGAQAFGHEPSFGEALFARDATALYGVERVVPPVLKAFAAEAHIGPFVATDLDADLKPDVFAAIENGVAWLRGEGAESAEFALPEGVQVLDVESVRLGESALRPVALIRSRSDDKMLSLLSLPAPPWRVASGAGPAWQLVSAELKAGQSPAEVALE